MEARRAWVLNLDADLELGAPGRYEPSKSVLSAMRPHVARLQASLLGAGDVLIDEASGAEDARGLAGLAFCPTPRAVALLARAGADPEPHPSIEVLRRVNSRAFASALGPTLPGAAFVTDLTVALAMLAGGPPVGDAWRVKYAFGMAGRNQRVVPAGPASPRDAAWVREGVRLGGVQIEPNLRLEQEYALHGMLEPDGRLRVGELVRQRCDPRGTWVATERLPAGEDHAHVAAPLAAEVEQVARALHRAGYFGPFGVDAYSYRDRRGALLLQPRSEINARFSMGFSVGFRHGCD